ncbi:VapB-type antitoxin [Sulfolobales archaeon HS-7]|nr:VapB-type antitoxin [Sulfolobales archaeon HS-7]
MSDVISVRVRRELKRRAEELGLNVREVIERALEDAISQKEKDELRDTATKIKELMKDVREEDWITAVREDRNER